MHRSNSIVIGSVTARKLFISHENQDFRFFQVVLLKTSLTGLNAVNCTYTVKSAPLLSRYSTTANARLPVWLLMAR